MNDPGNGKASAELVRLAINISRIVELPGPQCWALMRNWNSSGWFAGPQQARMIRIQPKVICLVKARTLTTNLRSKTCLNVRICLSPNTRYQA